MSEPPNPTASKAPTNTPPKLSGAELKKQKQLEKQAKRAAQKAAAGINPHQQPSNSSQPSSSSSQPQTSIPFRQEQGGSRDPRRNAPAPNIERSSQAQAQAHAQAHAQAQQQPQSHSQSQQLSKATAVTNHSSQKDDFMNEVPLFEHLTISRRTNIESVSKDVHPAVLAFGTHLSNYEIAGSSARVLALIEVFKKVTRDYKAPTDTAIARHFIPHCLSAQIEYIKSCRPLGVSMANLIRYFKDKIVQLDPSLDEGTARGELIKSLADYATERIAIPHRFIILRALEDVFADKSATILTYGNSSVVRQALQTAYASGTYSGTVLVLQASVPLFQRETTAFVQTLRQQHCPPVHVEVWPLAAARRCIQRADRVLIGAAGVFADGSILGRAGTALVAAWAARCSVAVHVLAAQNKFTDRVAIDSWAIGVQELAPVREVFGSGCGAAGYGHGGNDDVDDDDVDNQEERFREATASLDRNVKGLGSLGILNPMYDVMPVRFVHRLISDLGSHPPSDIGYVVSQNLDG